MREVDAARPLIVAPGVLRVEEIEVVAADAAQQLWPACADLVALALGDRLNIARQRLPARRAAD